MSDKLNVVTAAAAVVFINGAQTTLYRGDPLPSTTPESQVEHLISVGLVEAVDAPDEITDVEEPEFPSGEPSDAWTAKQLVAYAVAHDIDLGAAKSKGDVVKVVVKPAEPSTPTPSPTPSGPEL